MLFECNALRETNPREWSLFDIPSHFECAESRGGARLGAGVECRNSSLQYAQTICTVILQLSSVQCVTFG